MNNPISKTDPTGHSSASTMNIYSGDFHCEVGHGHCQSDIDSLLPGANSCEGASCDPNFLSATSQNANLYAAAATNGEFGTNYSVEVFLAAAAQRGAGGGGTSLSANAVDPASDHFSLKATWKLSSNSEYGGWVVQHIIGDWPKSDDKVTGHWEYWEAWYIGKGKTETKYHNKFGFDDNLSGNFGTKIHAAARFYDGLKLPPTFKVGSVLPAHDLRATTINPMLPTTNATQPVIRDFKP